MFEVHPQNIGVIRPRQKGQKSRGQVQDSGVTFVHMGSKKPTVYDTLSEIHHVHTLKHFSSEQVSYSSVSYAFMSCVYPDHIYERFNTLVLSL